jgi:transposase
MLSSLRYLAVDVSKSTLVAALERHRWQFANSRSGHRQLIAHIKKLPGPIQVVCEASGPYHLPMCLALQQAGLPVSVVNGAQVRHFALCEGHRAKNDPADAKLIARFAQARQLAADPPLCHAQLALAEMVAFRRQLVDSIKRFATYRQQIAYETSADVIDQTIATLKRSKCAALAGLAPYDDDSGTLHRKRFIHGGRREVRCALYMAALSAARSNPVLKTFYQRLRNAHKPFKVAITAVMRKLLLHLNSLLQPLCLNTPTPAP